eukprot:jgi/Botrbrau1/22161/Bobra.0206s0084.1
MDLMHQWTIPKKDLEIGRELRSLHDYKAHFGRWQQTDVEIRVFEDHQVQNGKSSSSKQADGPSVPEFGNRGFPSRYDKKEACFPVESFQNLPKSMQIEVQVMAATRHPNVVMLLGVCLEGPYLITELCSKGTLADLLSKARAQSSLPAHLKWISRLKMAWEISKGIAAACICGIPFVVHADLRTANILVNSSWHCKVSEFGRSHRAGDVAKPYCYEAANNHHVAPEVQGGGEVTLSPTHLPFGVMLLELNNPPAHQRRQFKLVQRSGPHDVRVRDLMGKVEASLGESVRHMREYSDLAIRCTAMDPFSRPSFEVIVAELKTLLYDTAKILENTPCK